IRSLTVGRTPRPAAKTAPSCRSRTSFASSRSWPACWSFDLPTQLGQHDQLVPSEIPVEMQTVSVGISNVELTRARSRVTDLSPVEIGASDRELFEEFIDVRNNESVRWSIALTKVLGLVPLKVQFNTVTTHASVFRLDGRVPKGGLKAKQLI